MILFILWRIVSLNNCIHNVKVALIDLCAVILHIDIQEVHIYIYYTIFTNRQLHISFYNRKKSFVYINLVHLVILLH